MFFACVILQAQNVRFALLTDLHVVPSSANDSTLRIIVSEINRSNYQYVFITGDLTNQGSDVELRNVKEILNGLTVPYHIISGNHETTWSESGCKTFSSIWGPDRFAFTDSRYLYIGFPCGPYMKMGDGFIKYEDLLWVQKTIREKLRPGMKIINFAHYPLDESLSNYSMVTNMLKANRTAVSFCGHGHQIQLMNFDGIPGIMGRATASRDGKSFGYNEVEVTSDSLVLFEKVIGATRQRRVAISMSSNNLSAIKSSPEQLKIGTLAHATRFFQDDASIFNGVERTGDQLILANSLGVVKSVSVKTGKLTWSKKYEGSIYARPTVSHGVILLGTANGVLYGLRAADGRELWSVKSPRILVGTPTVEGDFAYVASSSEFMKVDVLTGKVQWRNALPRSYSQGAPAISGNRVILGAWDTNLYCLDKQSGQLLWSWNNGKKVDLLSPGNVRVVATDKAVFLVAPDRYMTALNINTGEVLWRSNDYTVRESMGVSADGQTVYAKTMDGKLLAVEASTQKFNLLWSVDAGIGYEHNPCPTIEHNGVVYMGSRKGEVVAVDAQTHQLLWIEKVGYSSVNSFTVDEKGTLWLSLVEGLVFRIG